MNMSAFSEILGKSGSGSVVSVIGHPLKPQGGPLRLKDTSHWQLGCDRTPARAGLGYCLKSPVLSDISLDKLLFAIAYPNVGRDFDWLVLFVVCTNFKC